ncbi:MAG: GIY-YIG nuclease family protein [Thermoplasmata archaeon]|nr:GIY-YIG nuclease family protein [Thermoplasmata archaeon]
MNNEHIGYHEDPKNNKGIIKSRTTKQVRSWEIPREMKSLEAFNNDLRKIEFPGIYILFEGKNKVYIGEAKNIYERLKTHINNPEDKIKNWNKTIVINDGRPANQSDFNDNVIRKELELYLIKLFKANKYNVVSQGEPHTLNSTQKSITESFKKELNYFLSRKNVITKELEEEGKEEIFDDEIRKILKKSGKKIKNWTKKEGFIDSKKVFIRPGSEKSKGWQITFRGSKKGSFFDSLKKGDGFLLVSRNGLLLIPLFEVQKVIKEKSAYKQNTIDVFINFEEDKATLTYKDKTIDVTHFKLK